MIFKTVFNRFGGRLGDKELEILSEVMKTPKETLRAMNNAAAREALTLDMIRTTMPKMTMGERLRAGGAGSVTQAAEQ